MMKKNNIRRKKIKIADKHKKMILICSFLAIFVVASVIILSYSNLNNLKNNSVATDLSFNNHPAIVNHLNETAKSAVGKGGRDFNLFYDNTHNGANWCAMFIWWLFNQDGRAKNLISKSAYADNLVRDSIKAGKGTWLEDNCNNPNTQPKAGDLVVFNPNKNKNSYSSPYVPLPDYLNQLENYNDHDKYVSSHIGYVYKVDNDYIYTIEGNTGSGDAYSSVVSKKSYRYKDKSQCGKETYNLSINGYYRPNYGPHYTVKFMPNGGTGSMSIQYFKRGESKKLLANKFTRAGYTFFGWVAQRDTGEKFCSDTPGNNYKWLKSGCYGHYYFYDQQELTNTYGNDGVVYMYAQWKKNTTTKTPAPAKPQQAAPTSPTKATPQTIQTPSSKQFTVKYYNGGGTGSMNDQIITYGSSNSNLYGNSFKRIDYKFLGWNAQREDDRWYCFTNSSKTKAGWLKISDCRYGFYLYKNKQSVPTIVKPGSYVKMVAQWHPTTFIVKFRANGGSGSMSDQKMTYGSKNTLKSNYFSRSGYVFGGWVAQRWDGKIYCYTSPSKTKAGWLSSDQCDNYYYFRNNQQLTTTVPGGKTVTMFAQWKSNKFHIAYYSGGGSGSMKNQIINYGTPTKLYGNAFVRRGYRFDGWIAQRDDYRWYCYTSPSHKKAAWLKIGDCEFGHYYYKDKQTVSTTVQPGSYVKMVAQWKTNKFTVRFNANGGSGKMYDQEIIYGEPTKLYGNAFKKSGYKFDGWVAQRWDGKIYCNTSPSKQFGVWKNKSDCVHGFYHYKDKQSVSKTAQPNEMVTFFAQWIRS